MTDFEKVVIEVESTGGKVSPQVPTAKWRHLDGYFTAEQLRVIADQIEREYKGK